MKSGMERRMHERVELQGVVADIADEGRIFDGVIEDVSTTGFRMSGLRNRFAPKAKNYLTVIAFDRKNFKILVRPRWKKTEAGGASMEVGFKIVDVPYAWTEMVQDMLPDQENLDIWGDVN